MSLQKRVERLEKHTAALLAWQPPPTYTPEELAERVNEVFAEADAADAPDWKKRRAGAAWSLLATAALRAGGVSDDHYVICKAQQDRPTLAEMDETLRKLSRGECHVD